MYKQILVASGLLLLILTIVLAAQYIAYLKTRSIQGETNPLKLLLYCFVPSVGLALALPVWGFIGLLLSLAVTSQVWVIVYPGMVNVVTRKNFFSQEHLEQKIYGLLVFLTFYILVYEWH